MVSEATPQPGHAAPGGGTLPILARGQLGGVAWVKVDESTGMAGLFFGHVISLCSQ